LKLDGLPFLHNIPDRHRSGRLVGADEISDEKISSFKVVPVFVDDDAQVQCPMGAPAVFSCQGIEHSLQPLQRRYAP
jgi:hypothetical protein